MRYVPVIALLVLLSAYGIANAEDPVAEGQAAYDEGYYKKALSIWRPLAEQGDAEAQRLAREWEPSSERKD